MSNERQPQPFDLFPLDTNTMNEAEAWLLGNTSSPEQLTTEIGKLRNKNYQLYLYAYDMGFLRRLVQFEDDEITQNAYWNGALYMLKAIESKYAEVFKDVPTPSNETMSAHFFNLTISDLNYGALKSFAPQIFDDLPFHERMTEFLKGHRTETFDQLADIFAINSQKNVHSLFERTPQLEKRLTRGGLQQSHGPALGLVYGAYDMHEIFSLHEERNAWEKKWNGIWEIPVK